MASPPKPSVEILLAREGGVSRGAVVADGVVTDYRVARAEAPGRAGGVYRGRVMKTLPGFGGAIVSLPGGEAWLDLARAGGKIAEGMSVTAQVLQEGWAGKRPRASLAPAIAGRFLAFMPGAKRAAFSHRIAEGAARARLGALLAGFGKAGAAGQFLALHRAARANDAVLRHEAERLRAAWASALTAAIGEGPAVLVPPADAAMDLLRLFVDDAVARIAVDSEALAGAVRGWLAESAPEWQGRVEREPVGRARLDSNEVREEIEAALEREVPLVGGGALLIDETAALTAIDVDTDRGANGYSAATTFAAVNREAAGAIARQIRLRNLGGRVAIDFAGLGAGRNLAETVRALRRAVADDPMAVEIAAPSALGLVELVRRRERPTLAAMLGRA
jgi:Rne/Rng family ribonuclease